MRFSRQEYWSGLPCPLPGDLPNPGIKPESLMSPSLAGGFFLFFVFFFTTSVTWEAHLELYSCIFLTWLFIEIDCPFSGQLLHFLSTKRLKALLICIQFSSVAQLTLCNPMDYSTPGFPVRHQLPELAQTHVYGVGDAIQLSHPLCPLLLLPSIFPNFRVFSNESVLCLRWPKYWSFSFSFSVSPSNEHSGLISFRMD